MTRPVTMLTPEQAEALRRASSQPDLFSADPGIKKEERVYAPLVRLGFLTREVRPWPANDLYDLIHYETTETGKWALRLFDKYEREGYPDPCPEAYRLVRDGSK